MWESFPFLQTWNCDQNSLLEIKGMFLNTVTPTIPITPHQPATAPSNPKPTNLLLWLNHGRSLPKTKFSEVTLALAEVAVKLVLNGSVISHLMLRYDRHWCNYLTETGQHFSTVNSTNSIYVLLDPHPIYWNWHKKTLPSVHQEAVGLRLRSHNC